MRRIRSWLKTIFEAGIDVGSGFFLALLTQLTLIPWIFDIEFTGIQSVGIVITFTCVSIIRSTLWRRFFKNRHKVKTELTLYKTGVCPTCGTKKRRRRK